MKLYTCAQRTRGGSLPGPLGHPCGRAAKALDDAGHSYEIETVGGYKVLPWTRRGRRDEIRRLTGQEDVPVLVVGPAEVVQGTSAIIDWAGAHPG